MVAQAGTGNIFMLLCWYWTADDPQTINPTRLMLCGKKTAYVGNKIMTTIDFGVYWRWWEKWERVGQARALSRSYSDPDPSLATTICTVIKSWKTSAVSTTVWMVETQLCKLRGTWDTFVKYGFCELDLRYDLKKIERHHSYEVDFFFRKSSLQAQAACVVSTWIDRAC